MTTDLIVLFGLRRSRLLSPFYCLHLFASLPASRPLCPFVAIAYDRGSTMQNLSPENSRKPLKRTTVEAFVLGPLIPLLNSLH
jgi:hypothetical protein